MFGFGQEPLAACACCEVLSAATPSFSLGLLLSRKVLYIYQLCVIRQFTHEDWYSIHLLISHTSYQISTKEKYNLQL
jgi:hypothetical protein